VYDNYTAGYITPLGGRQRADCSQKAESIFTHAVVSNQLWLRFGWLAHGPGASTLSERALYPLASSRLLAAVSGSATTRRSSAWPVGEGERRGASGFPFVGGMEHPGEGSPQFETVSAKAE
jgi:hypothetical protein